MAVDFPRRHDAKKEMEEEGKEQAEDEKIAAGFPSEDAFWEQSHGHARQTDDEEPDDKDRGKTFWSVENETNVAGAP